MKLITNKWYKKRFEQVDPYNINLDDSNIFVLNDFSGEYNAIPKVAAQRFAELIVPELKKLGIKVDEIVVCPTETL